jgi:hypothetical protein
VLAFAAIAVDDPTETLAALLEGAELYAHPSPALTAAQAFAGANGLGSSDRTPLAAVEVVFMDDGMWAACCGQCFHEVGDTHASVCDRDGGVMPHEAVVRPLENVVGTRSALPVGPPRPV